MFTVALDKCEVNEYSEKAEKFVDDLNDLLGSLSSASFSSVEETEGRVLERIRSLGKSLLEMGVSESAEERNPEPVMCPECQEVCSPLRKLERSFTTLCGVIRVKRWVYRCASGHNCIPWDTIQKMRGRYTHRVAEAMCRLVTHLDYREASKELSKQGIEVSHTTLHKRVCEWAKDVKVFEQVEKQTLEDKARWYVSYDGCHTNSPVGYKETKVGCIFTDFPQHGRDSVPSARTSSIRYTASRENTQQFGKELYALATQSGMYQENIDTQEVVVIGDGAAWIWNLANEHFPNGVEIVDYMHAKSHLYTVVKQAFGELETQVVEEWVEVTEPFLYDGNTQEVVERISALDTQNPDVVQILERGAGYFKKHSERMQDRTFSEKGYQIVSGVIESACKHVVAERCKRASMRWTKDGLNAVLTWKCIHKNGSWDRTWYPDTKAA